MADRIVLNTISSLTYLFSVGAVFAQQGVTPVSSTHLDVYKRQPSFNIEIRMIPKTV